MGTIIAFPRSVQARGASEMSVLAECRALQDACDHLHAQTQSLLTHLEDAAACFRSMNADCTWTIDFCQRAQNAFRADGSVDEAAYEALKATFAAFLDRQVGRTKLMG